MEESKIKKSEIIQRNISEKKNPWENPWKNFEGISIRLSERILEKMCGEALDGVSEKKKSQKEF